MVKTIEWTDAGVVMIDQRILPTEETYITCKDYLEVADAIQTMVIRGAPAIGVAAAMGFAIGVEKAADENLDAQVEEISKVLAATRPTAVNLFWAIERMKRLYALLRTEGAELPALRQRLIDEAKEVLRDDIEINKA
ncbi:MAG: S-methyl-5-thioribose-1-phosphate isomerase, partial [Acidobacteria bacterium]|nr:S-methyl-5-thioribose-1-phosphate isomerase [Acidobacteriota bacterium]